MTQELYNKYGQLSVPRYTSYPTAPHFTPNVSSNTHHQWLTDVQDDEHISLYIHVPYCKSLCAYCGCHTLAIKRDEPLDVYQSYLTKEILLTSQKMGHKKIRHIHWGGGTPSILGAERFAQLFKLIQTHFDLSHLIEHAIELDPRFMEDAFLLELKNAGINRVSFGVQDLNLHVQETIGRIQSYDVVANANDKIRAIGVQAINMDLIYGLPNQTISDAETTAEQIIKLQPNRLAVFGYAHVPWFKARQKLIQEPQLPDGENRIVQEEKMRSILMQNGYMSIGIDHFALPDDTMAQSLINKTLHRNFQGYTTDTSKTLIGMGASSISQFAKGYTQNAPDLGNWKRALDENCFATTRGYFWSQEDKFRYKVIEKLMCYGHTNPYNILKQNPCSVDLDFILSNLTPYLEDGLCVWSGNDLIITPLGRIYTRVIASAFDQYLQANPMRHAKAV